jgi:AraC-like DNA-binding protein
MMGKKYFIPFCISMCCFSIYGQQNGKVYIDSLKGKSYEYFLEKLQVDEQDENSIVLSNAYLQKAKSEKNWKQMMNAYKIILHQVPKKQRIFYADSMIVTARRTKENDLIGSAYLTKGIVYYDLQDFNNALDNYLIADEFIATTTDEYLKYKAKYNIAQIKYYLGFYDEAALLFQENIRYFKSEDDIPYLTSLHALGLCYNRLGKYELCSATNDKGIKEATELEYYDAIPRFVNSEGINQYFKKNYAVSIAKLNESLPTFIKSKDSAGETVTYFYLGKNYWALNQTEKAIQYFIKVDEAFIEKNYTYPDLRESFEILIDHYKSKNDHPNQLKYIDQLLLADKYLNSNYKYLSGRIHKEYDTKKLIQAKDEIEELLRFEKKQNIFFIILIAILIGWLGYMIYKARENKRKFRKLMERKTQQSKPTAEIKLKNTGNLNINPDVIASVLKHLDKFEASEKFLAKDITLPKLAKMFDSNIVYVSKIISHSRQKKSTDYVNDLKIDYIIIQLRENSRFRNYTNKALGEEAGFSTTQHFTRAFSKNTGISPTYFIQELKKTISAGNLP